MSPALQQVFMTEIAPMLESTVRRVVRPVGSEDVDELVQDALVAACQAVDSLERRNRPIPSSSVVHYTLQRLKSGRRSTSGGRTDVMSPGCQFDGCSVLESLDAPLETNDGTAEEVVCLGDVIAARRDDPASQAVRQLDWAEFMSDLSAAQQQMVWATAVGFGTKAQAMQKGVSCPSITQQKRTVARKAQAFWGNTLLQDAADKPLWRKARASR